MTGPASAPRPGRRFSTLPLCFVAAVLASPGALAQDALGEVLRNPAQAVAREVDNVWVTSGEAGGERLILAVRPARMYLDGHWAYCPPLSQDLQDKLRAALNEARTLASSFDVRAMDPDVIAKAEVNTEWRLDRVDGSNVLLGEVHLLVGEERVAGGLEMQFQMLVEHLSGRQKGCMFSLNADERFVTIPEGGVVTVYGNPGYGLVEKIHEGGERLHKVASLNPVVEGDQVYQAWWMVRDGALGYRFLPEPSWGGGNQREVGRRFRDCPECPELVVVRSGSFMMGSPSHEEGRDGDEGPVRRVRVGEPFAAGVYEVTVSEFGQFVDETGHSTGGSCKVHEGGVWRSRDDRGWRNPGFGQGGSHPVMCVSWHDARAYVGWLSRRTGERYRLLSESEWEYVARAGTRTARYWGEGESGQCGHANGSDTSTKRQPSFTTASCDDGHVHTAPVGSYGANAWGLHDVLGNVWEWTADCWSDSYTGAPGDGSAWKNGNCSNRVLRGGSWYSKPRYLRSANRTRFNTGLRYNHLGFRVARTLTP